ncbi:hypothetical protein KIPB_000245 [Kipferlia bialata]|uniref:RZ-type domain-containing protein n=1 Tax=Kipferlia bialata TaxID=797122 RepID=A0A9K3CNW1_9EUKA|nr:hypothetical protein KIPB_000245 [Kipferlia bialata]|eukprot:g245.t1
MTRSTTPVYPPDVLSVLETLGKMAKCPCGEVYVVGDCGLPWEVARCPTCGSAIGGTGDHFVPGNATVTAAELLNQ